MSRRPSKGGGTLARGDLAPGFELPDQDGRLRRLEDYRGRWLVLYFYPRDDTPGCTAEACEFRDARDVLADMGVEVVGVSLDGPRRHREFAGRHGLAFTLLSDAGGRVAASYGALRSLGFFRFARRHTFILDPDGRVARVYRKVRPRGHAGEVIAGLAELGIGAGRAREC